MSEVDWKKFWASYRKKEVSAEGDLYFEVGKTINGQPMSEAAFQLSIDVIVRGLGLSEADRLLELCCGNGLMTRRLAPLVEQIQAVDFAEHLIKNAFRFSSARNVHYFCADAVAYLNELALNKTFVPSKILLGDCLCYFDPQTLEDMLRLAGAVTENKFVFMASGVPCDELKSNFYNTPERVQRYEENQRLPENTNDGIGRWWRKEQLEHIARRLALRVVVRNQPRNLSNFRVDAVFKNQA